MRTAFVLYDQMTALDMVGPYEVLAGHPLVTPHFVARHTGDIRCDNGLVLHADTTFDDSSVQSGQTYFYVTTAVDGSGNESVNSNQAQVVVPTP